jgi:hypothetical protein
MIHVKIRTGPLGLRKLPARITFSDLKDRSFASKVADFTTDIGVANRSVNIVSASKKAISRNSSVADHLSSFVLTSFRRCIIMQNINSETPAEQGAVSIVPTIFTTAAGEEPEASGLFEKSRRISR